MRTGECYPCGRSREPERGLCPSCGHPLEIGDTIPPDHRRGSPQHGITLDEEASPHVDRVGWDLGDVKIEGKTI